MVSFTRNEYDILVVVLSWIAGFTPLFWARLRGRPSRLTWVQCVGIALIAVPFARMAVSLTITLPALTVFTVLEPVSRAALWRSVGRDVLFQLAFPIAGLLLAHRGRAAEAVERNGLAPKASWRRDAARGFTLFFCIAAAYTVALVLSRQISPALAGGDESQYWRNITLPLIVLVSGMAGLTEELLFRGILLTRLAKVMPWIAAALVQAILFGLIHAGYGTWTHVVAPAAFGFGMAWVTRVLGILPAMLLHAQVNIVYFALDVSDAVPSAWLLVLALGVVNVWAALATRFDAIRLLWRSLLDLARRPGRATA